MSTPPTTTRPKKPGPKLADINPQKGDKYSPALFRWLQKQQRIQRFSVDPKTELPQVYRSRAGGLFIGEMGRIVGRNDLCFVGVGLMRVLSYGPGFSVEMRSFNAQQSKSLRLVKTFWTRYLAIGRCALDPKHDIYFGGAGASRYKTTSKTRRTCQWCGHCQRLVRRVEKVQREEWVNL